MQKQKQTSSAACKLCAFEFSVKAFLGYSQTFMSQFGKTNSNGIIIFNSAPFWYSVPANQFDFHINLPISKLSWIETWVANSKCSFLSNEIREIDIELENPIWLGGFWTQLGVMKTIDIDLLEINLLKWKFKIHHG